MHKSSLGIEMNPEAIRDGPKIEGPCLGISHGEEI